MRLLDEITDHRFTAAGCELQLDHRHIVTVAALPGLGAPLLRVWVRKDGRTRVPRSWAVPAPDAIDVPWEGRERTSIDDEALPVECAEDGDEIVLTCGDVRVRVASSPLRLTFQRRLADEWVTVLADRPTGAYFVGSDAVDLPTLTAPEGTDVAHMVLQVPGERIVGLGEKAGPLDRSGRRYEMRALDAMGYDASRTDPLYKHWPMWIRTVPGAMSDPGRSDSPDATSAPASTSPSAVGVFYDNHSRCDIDLGLARDNYHAEFSSWHADSGDIDLYVMLGDSCSMSRARLSR